MKTRKTFDFVCSLPTIKTTVFYSLLTKTKPCKMYINSMYEATVLQGPLTTVNGRINPAKQGIPLFTGSYTFPGGWPDFFHQQYHQLFFQLALTSSPKMLRPRTDDETSVDRRHFLSGGCIKSRERGDECSIRVKDIYRPIYNIDVLRVWELIHCTQF